MTVSTTLATAPLEKLLRTLAKDPARFARAVRAASFAIGAELHPLRWHRAEGAPLNERTVNEAHRGLFDGAELVRDGARLGVEELRAVIAVHEAQACRAHRASLVVASATKRKPKSLASASTWPAGDPCAAQPANETNEGDALRAVVVLAERAGRRLVLLCGVIPDRDGWPRPSVRVCFQRHRDGRGWASVGRELFLPWASLATVRAAIESTEAAATNEAAALWTREREENRR